ncbi:hypothetical protein J40TS1_47880 [Paenibacillus montaniterrae]|uniref:DUF2759 domain-containing protein n=1 Tax=Paenibacillus montaniterrae TaxID=429341 RepID=A0A920CZR9_9BACL|nr:hypothetical protein [Paenibacillus montaniterrae]GIP19146.1 hypothetical protein J40TS1_47880 [Paenibacillus montaniterrae]
MFLAEGTSTGIDPFDWFMLAFTVIIAIGFVRLVTQKEKNKFAIGFAGVSLLLFLFIDFVMIKETWLGIV